MSFEDKDFDDAALWALMDSAASAASLSSKPRKSCQNLTLTPVSYPPHKTLTFPSKSSKPNPNHNSHSPSFDSYGSARSDGGEVVQHEPQRSVYCNRTPTPPLPPRKIARTGTCSVASREVTPMSLAGSSSSMLSVASPEAYLSPGIRVKEEEAEEGKEIARHSLAGRFPSVSLFKEYQNAAMAVCLFFT